MLFVVFAASLMVAAQSPAQIVTTADLQQAQDEIDRAAGDIADLRSRDADLARDLQRQLDEARDDVAYFRVTLRHNDTIARRDFDALRDKLDQIRSRARGESPRATTVPAAEDDRRLPSSESESDQLSVGTEFDVRLQTSLSSATARVEDRFDATTVADIRRGDRTVVPAGSVVRGMVSAVTKTTRLERKGSLTVVFDRITIDGRSYAMHATVVQALQSEGIRGEAGKIGVGAAAGAIIGGLLGGAKGAIAGILIGGGGTLAATEGKDLELPAGTLLRVRLDSPFDLPRAPLN
jgi:hypothetical protein